MPLWVTVLLMAERWGVPPWEIEEKLTKRWYECFMVLEEEKQKAEAMRPKPVGRGPKVPRM